MDVIDDGHIQSLVKQLEEAVPRIGRVQLVSDEDSDLTLVRANRLGYLRLGVEFLRAAYAPTEAPDGIKVELGYLTGLEYHCYSFERREDEWNMEVAEEPSGSPGKIAAGLGNIAAGLVVLMMVAAFGIGLTTILEWLMRALEAILRWLLT